MCWIQKRILQKLLFKYCLDTQNMSSRKPHYGKCYYAKAFGQSHKAAGTLRFATWFRHTYVGKLITEHLSNRFKLDAYVVLDMSPGTAHALRTTLVWYDKMSQTQKKHLSMKTCKDNPRHSLKPTFQMETHNYFSSI